MGVKRGLDDACAGMLWPAVVWSVVWCVVWGAAREAPAGERLMEFHCPRVYQGIKSDMLPSYWEPTDQGKDIRAGQSHVQGRYLICIYREANGKQIGNVRRLAPRGYRCITDGRGVFQCRRRESPGAWPARR